MLFSHLFNTVVSLYGPVIDYQTYNASSHVSYEYIVTKDKKCHIALGVTRNDDESRLSWESFPVTDEKGKTVVVRARAENPISNGIVQSNLVFASVQISGPNDGKASDTAPDSLKTVYLMEPTNSVFHFSIDLKIKTRDGMIRTEKTNTTCDTKLCGCYENQ